MFELNIYQVVGLFAVGMYVGWLTYSFVPKKDVSYWGRCEREKPYSTFDTK